MRNRFLVLVLSLITWLPLTVQAAPLTTTSQLFTGFFDIDPTDISNASKDFRLQFDVAADPNAYAFDWSGGSGLLTSAAGQGFGAISFLTQVGKSHWDFGFLADIPTAGTYFMTLTQQLQGGALFNPGNSLAFANTSVAGFENSWLQAQSYNHFAGELWFDNFSGSDPFSGGIGTGAAGAPELDSHSLNVPAALCLFGLLVLGSRRQRALSLSRN